MERIIFFDPVEVKRHSAEPSEDPAPVPAAPGKLPSASQVALARCRESEVQQLIHDLAVLAATHRPRPHN